MTYGWQLTSFHYCIISLKLNSYPLARIHMYVSHVIEQCEADNRSEK